MQQERHLKYTHQLEEGVTPTTGYGLALARTVRLPKSILRRAEWIFKHNGCGADGASETTTSERSARSLVSNPVSRSYRRSQSQNHQQQADLEADGARSEAASSCSGANITQLERNAYDLYANIMEVLKTTAASDRDENNDDADDDNTNRIVSLINAKVEEFLDVCDEDDARMFRHSNAAEIMAHFRTVRDRDDQQRIELEANQTRLSHKQQPVIANRLRMQFSPTPKMPTVQASVSMPSGGSSTPMSQLSVHSVFRRYVAPEKRQVAAVASTSSARSAPSSMATMPPPARDACGFENMPNDFWESVDDFENRPENAELREYINDGLPTAADGRKRSLAVDEMSALDEDDGTAKNARTSLVPTTPSSNRRRVRFADQCQVFSDSPRTEYDPQHASDFQMASRADQPSPPPLFGEQNSPLSPSQNTTTTPWNDLSEWHDIFSDNHPPMSQCSQDDGDDDHQLQEADMFINNNNNNHPEGAGESTPMSLIEMPTFTQIEMEIESMQPTTTTTPSIVPFKVSELIPPPPTPSEPLMPSEGVVDIVIPAPLGY